MAEQVRRSPRLKRLREERGGLLQVLRRVRQRVAEVDPHQQVDQLSELERLIPEMKGEIFSVATPQSLLVLQSVSKEFHDSRVVELGWNAMLERHFRDALTERPIALVDTFRKGAPEHFSDNPRYWQNAYLWAGVVVRRLLQQLTLVTGDLTEAELAIMKRTGVYESADRDFHVFDEELTFDPVVYRGNLSTAIHNDRATMGHYLIPKNNLFELVANTLTLSTKGNALTHSPMAKWSELVDETTGRYRIITTVGSHRNTSAVISFEGNEHFLNSLDETASFLARRFRWSQTRFITLLRYRGMPRETLDTLLFPVRPLVIDDEALRSDLRNAHLALLDGKSEDSADSGRYQWVRIGALNGHVIDFAHLHGAEQPIRVEARLRTVSFLSENNGWYTIFTHLTLDYVNLDALMRTSGGFTGGVSHRFDDIPVLFSIESNRNHRTSAIEDLESRISAAKIFMKELGSPVWSDLDKYEHIASAKKDIKRWRRGIREHELSLSNRKLRGEIPISQVLGLAVDFERQGRLVLQDPPRFYDSEEHDNTGPIAMAGAQRFELLDMM